MFFRDEEEGGADGALGRIESSGADWYLESVMVN